jgi:hypothetical protein
LTAFVLGSENPYRSIFTYSVGAIAHSLNRIRKLFAADTEPLGPIFHLIILAERDARAILGRAERLVVSHIPYLLMRAVVLMERRSLTEFPPALPEGAMRR